MAKRSNARRSSLNKNTLSIELEIEEIEDENKHVLEFHRLIGLGRTGVAEERAKVAEKLAAMQVVPAPTKADIPAPPGAAHESSVEAVPASAPPPPAAGAAPLTATSDTFRLSATELTQIDEYTRNLRRLETLEAVFEEYSLKPGTTVKGPSACFRSNLRQHKCRRSEFHFDFVVHVTRSGDIRIFSAGACFKQGGDVVEVVAFAHERAITAITAVGDEPGAILPLKTIIELVDDEAARAAPEFAQYKERQAQLLKHYEDGESAKEAEERMKKLELEARENGAELAKEKKEASRARVEANAAKSKIATLEEAVELANEKVKSLTKDCKELKASNKRMDEMVDELTVVKEENAQLKRDLARLRRDHESTQLDLEQAKKRQRTDESGNYRPSAPVAPSQADNDRRGLVLDLESLHKTANVKSFSFNY